jgi:hypothetical protein
MARTADLARALAITALLAACKRDRPEPTPFEDILPGFEDPGTYEVPTHSLWTLDDPLRYASTIEVHDFDGDGRVELVVGAYASVGNGDFPGPNSGVFWPEEALGGGRLEDSRQIPWNGTDREYGGVVRVGDLLIVAGGPNDDGTHYSVFADGWAPSYAEATFTLAAGGLVVCDLDADGFQDLASIYEAVRGPLEPGASAPWTWTLDQRVLTIEDGIGWTAFEDGVGSPLVAFVPKPIPYGDIPDFAPWSWSGPPGFTITGVGTYAGSPGAWLARARVSGEERSRYFFVHPEFDAPLGEVRTMHDGVFMSTLAAEGDFDGDGLDELVLTAGHPGEHVFVSVFRAPLPAFASEQDAWVRLHLPAGASYIRSLRVADVDGDGRDDLVILYRHEAYAHRVVVITADDLLDRVPPVE